MLSLTSTGRRRTPRIRSAIVLRTGLQCLLGACAFALGATKANEPAFKGDGLCQFALHGFTLSAQSEASINQAARKLLEQHQAALGFQPRPDFRLRIRVFDRLEDFVRVPEVKGRTNLQGVYVLRTQEIVTWRQELPGFLGTTLLHEASHAIMHAHYRRVPMWLIEGAAEYFAYSLHPGNEANGQLLRKRWALLNLWLREEALLPLATLLNASQSEWDRLNPEKAYTMSWSLVQFLMSTDAHKRRVRTLLEEWQTQPRQELDGGAQMDRLYPGGLKQLELAWHRWIDPTGAARFYRTPFRGDGLCRFALRGHELTPETEKNLTQQVQTLLNRQSALLGFAPRPDFHLRIRIFGNFADYARFTTNWTVSGYEGKAGTPEEATDYYSPLFNEIVLLAQPARGQLSQRLLALANAAILLQHLPRVPRWIQLGSEHALVTAPALGGEERAPLLAAWKQLGLAAPRAAQLKAILDESAPQRNGKGGNTSTETEVLCWALFQFFSSSESNRLTLRAMLRNLPPSRGVAADCSPQIERLYAGGWPRFEADFKRWLVPEQRSSQ